MPHAEESGNEETTKAAAAKAKVVPKKSKWEGEDEDDDEPAVCHWPCGPYRYYLFAYI